MLLKFCFPCQFAQRNLRKDFLNSLYFGESVLAFNGFLGVTTGITCFMPSLMEFQNSDGNATIVSKIINGLMFGGSSLLLGNGFFQIGSLLLRARDLDSNEKSFLGEMFVPERTVETTKFHLKLNAIAVSVFQTMALSYFIHSSFTSIIKRNAMENQKWLNTFTFANLSLAASVYAINYIKSQSPPLRVVFFFFKMWCLRFFAMRRCKTTLAGEIDRLE